MEKVTQNIMNVGVNDREITLFEGQYVLEKGMAYNSYVILDEKVAIMDTVDPRVTEEWLKNLDEVLGTRKSRLFDYSAHGTGSRWQHFTDYRAVS